MMARLPSILKKAQHKITAREKLHLGREVLKMSAVVPDLSLLLPEILLNHIYLIFLLPSDDCLYIYFCPVMSWHSVCTCQTCLFDSPSEMSQHILEALVPDQKIFIFSSKLREWLLKTMLLNFLHIMTTYLILYRLQTWCQNRPCKGMYSTRTLMVHYGVWH